MSSIYLRTKIWHKLIKLVVNKKIENIYDFVNETIDKELDRLLSEETDVKRTC